MINKFIAAFALVLALVGHCDAQKSEPRKKITTKELSDSLDIEGPLGVKIGKMISVSGVAETTGDKIVTEWLIVDKVNGKTLKKPVRIEYTVYNWANVTRLQNGKRLELNIFQQIGMRGIPGGVTEQTVAVAVGWDYGLYTWAVVVNQTAPKPFAFPNKFYDNISGGHPFDNKTGEKIP